MQQEPVNLEDLRLDTERRLICKGSALVRFEYLQWNEYINRNPVKRKPDPKRVKHLKGIFRDEGCHSLQVEHHIPAVVDQDRLDAALEDARRKNRWNADTLPSNCATINSQSGYPELEFPGGIECRHGLHRIEAGKEWLPSTEKWWIVDLYLSGISYELDTLLIEEYANEEKPCDGEIYRKIREYESLSGNADSMISPATCVSLKNRWWARLKDTRKRKLRSLFRNSTLPARFDTLAKIPALFDAGMMITTLHETLGTRCYEQIQNYFDYTWTTWKGFMKGVTGWLRRIDKATVKTVELTAPGVSTSDAESLGGMVLGGTIFSDFSYEERAIIWENILAFKGIIPSLYTFFQDIHFLEACVNAVKRLITVPFDKTLFAALEDCYSSNRESQWVQISETTCRSEKGSRTYCMRLGILGLFAFVMREHQSLPKAPVKKNLKTIPRVKTDQEVLRQFAALAYQLGFNSPEIHKLKGDVDSLLVPDTRKSAPLLITTGPGEKKNQRCGLPRTDNFEGDRKHLFLDNLCEERHETGEGITSFFVLKSWFEAFFKPPQWKRQRPVLSMEGTSPPLQSEHVDEEDVDMEDTRPEILNQRERVQGNDDEKVQETTGSVQRRISEPAVEANHMLEEEDTLFGIPTVPTTQSQVIEAGSATVIRFIYKEGDEVEIYDPLENYNAEELRLDHGDPTLLVQQQVQRYSGMGRRACDRYKKLIPSEECYNVAIGKENKNTLFLIREGCGVQRETAGHSNETLEGMVDTIEGLGSYESTREATQEMEGEHQVTGGLRRGILPQETEEDEEDPDLLDQEKDNAANAHILDRNTTVIYVKKSVGTLHEVSQPAKHWEWRDVARLEVPIDDPQGIVERRMRMFWGQRNWKPYDSNLRRLDDKDCYRAAAEDEEHTLYMMEAPQIKNTKAMDQIVPWDLQPPIALEAFSWHEKPRRGKLQAPARAQEETGFEGTDFVAPPNVLQLPSQELVESTAEVHRDKLGRGPDKPGDENSEVQNRIGMSFQEERSGTRKRPGGMRVIEQHML